VNERLTAVIFIGGGPARSIWCYVCTWKVPNYKGTSWGNDL